jgi:DNA end-binding protein Ku
MRPIRSPAAAQITLRAHYLSAGEEIEKEEVVKGYEYGRGQFVAFTAEELKALDVESTKVIDPEKFVPQRELNPVYLSSPYYISEHCL